MSEQYTFTDHDLREKHAKIQQAIDSEMPTVYVIRKDGRIDSGWIPYDTELRGDAEDINAKGFIVSLAKKNEDSGGYTLLDMSYPDFLKTQDEVREIENEALMHASEERKDRIRQVRMSAAYRKLRQTIDGKHIA